MKILSILGAILVCGCLAGCGAGTSTVDQDGVQDIEPGGKSVIVPPAANAPAPGNIRERAI